MSPVRVLVVRFSSLGDVVLTTPLLRALRRAMPDAAVTVATKADFAPVFAGNPAVDRLVTLERGEPLRTFTARVRAPFDLALDLHGGVRSLALRRAIRAPWRTYRKRRAARRLRVWAALGRGTPLPPVAERYFDAVTDLSIRPDGRPAELHPSPRDAEAARRIADGEYVVLAPGARPCSKRWPAGHWRALADRLRADGITVVGAGLPSDASFLPPPAVVPAYGIGLGPTFALLRGAAAAVANDSGLMHVAAAVGTPVVGLFGPTDPAGGFGPYRAAHRIVQRPMPCRPCSTIGGPRCPAGHHRCLRAIQPDHVLDALREMA